jgi:hypothetical protein
MQRLELATPPLRLLVDPPVFDDFRWCPPTTLTVRLPEGALPPGPVPTSRNPPGLAFVFLAQTEALALPRELAHLHVGRLSTEEEWCLAPWGIDAATDGLWEQRAIPNRHFALAAETLEALFWGLHDWVHFHHHGPFDRVAETEVQCDFGALAWIAWNRAILPIDDAAFEPLAKAVARLAAARLVLEALPVPSFIETLLCEEKKLGNGAIERHLMETCIDATTAT